MNILRVALAGTAAFAITSAAFAEGDKDRQQSRVEPPGQSASSGNSMQQNMGSGTVTQAQRALRQFGFEPGPADGMMGPRTRAALKEFQEARGIDATGRLNEETLAALNIGGSGSASAGASASSSGARESASFGSSEPERQSKGDHPAVITERSTAPNAPLTDLPKNTPAPFDR